MQIARNGDVVMVTKGVPPQLIEKGNIFDDFAEHASNVPNNRIVDAVTIVDRETGSVLARIEREGAVWMKR